jgi:bifunctional non-homologous end joining protein LigD
MSLAEYERKRKFEKTPEPKPVEERAGAGWHFVVQKHKATRLHYDFRLELDGVLKSWAVPKGPSLDPAEKRLAMEVEDHPVEYGGFEGRIPEGNYGAGTVMVWDRGTWEPVGGEGKSDEERAALATAMLEKGDLKFELHGTKLKGSFVLAKMKSRRPGSKGTEWLLIKHRDAKVEEGYDIDAHDGSVLSGRTMEEIAADKKSDEWGTKKNLSKAEVAKQHRHMSMDWKKLAGAAKGAVRGKMPEVVHPMLATLAEETPTDEANWLYEIKWDGYRALAFIEDGKARLVSRNQNDMTEEFAEVAAELPGRVRARRALLDGEIVALDEHGRSSFSLMQQRTGIGKYGRRVLPAQRDVAIAFYAFDLLYADDWKLMAVPLEERKGLLREALEVGGRILYSDHFDDGEKLLAAAREQGLEGIVAKRRDSHYEEKRTAQWRKIKITQTEECVIAGWTEPKGSREYFGSLVLGLYDKKGKLIPVGQAGTGFTRKTEAAIFKLLKQRETKQNPFGEKVQTSRGVHFVRPELVAQIKFTEWTHEGQKGGVKMRAPVFLGLREDKTAEECRAA